MQPRRRAVAGRMALTGPPSPPKPLRGAQRERLAAGTSLLRIYRPEPHGTTATKFRTNGPRSRFDHHRRPGAFPAVGEDPERRVLYAAPELICCVAEYFGDRGLVETEGNRVALLRLRAPLELLDVRGLGAMKAGTVAAVHGDGDRETTQDWARYWYEHPDLPGIGGLIYPGAHTSHDTVAVWERAEVAIICEKDWELADANVLPDILLAADKLGLAVF